jgi:hypothetical protein
VGCRPLNLVAANAPYEELQPIPHMEVVDCETREVIKAPKDCKYLALSYVWGQPTSSRTVNEELVKDNQIPNIMNDAMQVVLCLGFRYL